MLRSTIIIVFKGLPGAVEAIALSHRPCAPNARFGRYTNERAQLPGLSSLGGPGLSSADRRRPLRNREDRLTA